MGARETVRIQTGQGKKATATARARQSGHTSDGTPPRVQNICKPKDRCTPKYVRRSTPTYSGESSKLDGSNVGSDQKVQNSAGLVRVVSQFKKFKFKKNEESVLVNRHILKNF